MSASRDNPFSAAVRAAKFAQKQLAASTLAQRNGALLALAELLQSKCATILAANKLDLQAALDDALPDAMVQRLVLSELSLHTMASDLRQLAALPDPLAACESREPKQLGWRLRKQSVPLGVLAIIYESRPNVTIDCAALAIKSGNAALLRGGKEARHSNAALAELINQALRAVAINPDAIACFSGQARSELADLLVFEREIDLVIPRGGAGLHALCKQLSRIPVLSGGIGICHMFIDHSADLARSVEVVLNAKLQRPSACNALDVLLVHEKIAFEFCALLCSALAARSETGTPTLKLKACAQSFAHLHSHPDLQPAEQDDFDTEWLAPTLSVMQCADLTAALAHIETHGSRHSEAIMTETAAHAARFLAEVDAAAVYHNASTRFTDGAEFGLGAEVAVSTDKLHARGPMGLQALTTYKWLGEGEYTLRT